jgi:hypothetical protein
MNFVAVLSERLEWVLKDTWKSKVSNLAPFGVARVQLTRLNSHSYMNSLRTALLTSVLCNKTEVRTEAKSLYF